VPKTSSGPIDMVFRVEGHQNLDQASDQVERPALCRVIPPREVRRKYKIPDHCLNRVFGHYGQKSTFAT
jgi:hypothetical protein